MKIHQTENIDDKYRYQIKDNIEHIKSPEDIFDLFRELNYPQSSILNPTFKRDIKDFDFAKDEKSKIKDIYTILNFDEKPMVFLIESDTLSPSFIRYISKVFAERYLRLLLIFTVDYDELLFVFPEFEKVKIGKHKLKLSKLLLNKQELYYTDIETIGKLRFNEDWKSYRDVWLGWRDAFSVSRVTREFFEDYKNRFFRIRDHLVDSGIQTKSAHEFALQFLNRIMFIYFISKKRWLNDNTKFMDWLWNVYKMEVRNGEIENNQFYSKWLEVLFFEAFNNRFFDSESLPDEVKNTLKAAPFLNGGLFKQSDQDKLDIVIDDELIGDVIDFYNKYNFTIKEDVPLDVEVAVDPLMIGYVYESLANVAIEIYDRNDMGIFYTPRVEVDFMVRRSIVEYLKKHLEDVPLEIVYDFVFEIDKEKSRQFLKDKDMWYALEEVLENISIVDPACGSGAFLVGSLIVLTELSKEVYNHTNAQFSDFEIKKRILGRSLYGVDVMPWAVHAAELRLWLQLIVESKLKTADLKSEPLLPNLNMNLRVGDSLVQEIGGINLHLRDAEVSEKIRKKLYALKVEKENYYKNSQAAKFKSKEALEREEIRIFIEIIKEHLNTIDKELEDINNKFKRIQLDLFGNETGISKEEKEELKTEKEELTEQKNTLEKVLSEIEVPEKKPFVWEIAFSEIFGDKGGFDIVIGNPPYVRHEMISPPNKMKAEVTKDDKTEYKEKLGKSVKAVFPIVQNVGKKSDYYIYFYFHGLGILNPEGTFCFITSNSWLDVDYGKDLQQFLLKYVQIHAVYDNQSERSFEHADVNTIIALFGAPLITQAFVKEKMFQSTLEEGDYIKGIEWPMLSHTARFVMFKKPFEEVLSVENLLKMDQADEIVKTDDFRVFPINQGGLLEDGWEYPEGYDKEQGRFRKGKYGGNKWGGKYLRAPDIFFTILEKGKGKLVKLGDIADIRFGIKTGANEFFYLNDESQKKWQIEEKFLEPVIKSPRECKSIQINKKDLPFKLFMCHMAKDELQGTNALQYIEWGESQEFHLRPSCRGRQRWWDVGLREFYDVLWPMVHNDRFNVFSNFENIAVDHNLFEINTNTEREILTIYWYGEVLFRELLGRSNLGEGALKTEGIDIKKIPVFNPDELSDSQYKSIQKNVNMLAKRDSHSVFQELGFDSTKPIRAQEPKPLPDRKALDDVVFDAIGLTEDERKEVYWAVAELVKNRLDKAQSKTK